MPQGPIELIDQVIEVLPVLLGGVLDEEVPRLDDHLTEVQPDDELAHGIDGLGGAVLVEPLIDRGPDRSAATVPPGFQSRWQGSGIVLHGLTADEFGFYSVLMSADVLTPSEVASMFRVDPKTVTRWAKAGKLSSIRTLGGHRRYREAEVRSLLAGIPAPRTDT